MLAPGLGSCLDGPVAEDAKRQWAQNQKALARALGLSVAQWMWALEEAGERTTRLTAAAIGSGMAKGIGMRILDGLDGPKLTTLAKELIDERPVRAQHPLIREALRQGGPKAGAGRGRALLKRGAEGASPPSRAQEKPRPSAEEPTPDAPGDEP